MKIYALILTTLLAAFPALAVVTGANGYAGSTLFNAPDPANSPLVSFDWDEAGRFYYTTGDANWGTNFNVYQVDGTTTTTVYSTTEAFAGSRLTSIGDYVYFNDGGNYSRWTYDYFRYDPIAGGAPLNLTNGVTDMWGLATASGASFFGAGGWSAAIYYSPIDSNGDWTLNPPVSLGQLGESSGPIAFDAAGNLFYGNGYVAAGQPVLYAFSATALANAIANPAGAPLDPETAFLTTVEGNFSGVTGMAIDLDNNLIVSATNYGLPSEVRMYILNPAGDLLGCQTIATSPNRVDTLRFDYGHLYCNDADGVYEFALPPGVLYCRVLPDAAANDNPLPCELAFSSPITGLDPDFSDIEIKVIGSKGAKAAPSFLPDSLRSADNQYFTFDLDVTEFLGEISLGLRADGAIQNARGEALAAAYASSASHIVDTIIPEIDHLSVSQDRAGRGDVVTIEVYVTEALAEPPQVTVNGNAASYVPEKTSVYTYSYEVSGKDSEGPARIAVSGVDRAGNPTGVYAVTDLLWLEVPKLPLAPWPLALALLTVGALAARRRKR